MYLNMCHWVIYNSFKLLIQNSECSSKCFAHKQNLPIHCWICFRLNSCVKFGEPRRPLTASQWWACRCRAQSIFCSSRHLVCKQHRCRAKQRQSCPPHAFSAQIRESTHAIGNGFHGHIHLFDKASLGSHHALLDTYLARKCRSSKYRSC